MKLRILLLALAAGYLATFALLGPASGPSRAQDRRPAGDTPLTPAVTQTGAAAFPVIVHPFDPVWAVMNRAPADNGCVGCHIAPQPVRGFWFGETREEVLETLETGVNPNGDVLQIIPVEGGRMSLLGLWLHAGVMPRNGTRWGEADLLWLDSWLMLYE